MAADGQVAPKRPRGRPRTVDDPVRVCVRISGEAYDRLDAIARHRGESVPDIIREMMAQRLFSALLNTPALDSSVS